VFVFPSRKEGMGIAPVEAMSVGLPVIIARIPGITDLANQDQKTGLYVPVGDAKELKQAMGRLGEQPELRLQMGACARQRVLNKFGWQQYITCWEEVYSN
jgi:glycosyltransferase involved in cell wall biosynthesis